VKTVYTPTDGGFVLHGRKKWISYGAVADQFLVFANHNGAMSAFMVDRNMKGLSTHPMSGLLGNRGAHIAEVHLNHVVVPQSSLVGRQGAGFSFVANTALFYGRFSIAWAGLALAEAALEEMVGYARKREQFGKKLRQHQLIQTLIADAVTDVHTCRALCEKAAMLRAAGDDDAIMETNIAKYHTSKAAMAVSMNAVQVFGGNGCWNHYPVERLFREAKILEIIEGTSQIQQIMLSEFGVRRYYRPQKASH
jgi:alkylation response protein AidB-like acyl-CoA dehydrogenase